MLLSADVLSKSKKYPCIGAATSLPGDWLGGLGFFTVTLRYKDAHITSCCTSITTQAEAGGPKFYVFPYVLHLISISQNIESVQPCPNLIFT